MEKKKKKKNWGVPFVVQRVKDVMLCLGSLPALVQLRSQL